MKFTDFKQNDLVGKLVLWTTSNVVANEDTKIILPIVVATRFGFQIKDNQDKWFSYQGFEKIVGGKRGGPVSYCKLITETNAEDIKKRFADSMEKSKHIDTILANKKNLFRLDVAQLEQMANAVLGGRVGADSMPSFELKTMEVKETKDSEIAKYLSSVIDELQSDTVQLIKNHREKLSLLNAKLKSTK